MALRRGAAPSGLRQRPARGAAEVGAALGALQTAGVPVRIEPLRFGGRIAAQCYVLPSGEHLGARYLAGERCPDLWNLNERVLREAMEEADETMEAMTW